MIHSTDFHHFKLAGGDNLFNLPNIYPTLHDKTYRLEIVYMKCITNNIEQDGVVYIKGLDTDLPVFQLLTNHPLLEHFYITDKQIPNSLEICVLDSDGLNITQDYTINFYLKITHINMN